MNTKHISDLLAVHVGCDSEELEVRELHEDHEGCAGSGPGFLVKYEDLEAWASFKDGEVHMQGDEMLVRAIAAMFTKARRARLALR